MENRVGVDSSVYYILVLICICVLLLSIFLVRYVVSSISAPKDLKYDLMNEQDQTTDTGTSRTRMRGRGVQRLRMGLARRGENLDDIAPRPTRIQEEPLARVQGSTNSIEDNSNLTESDYDEGEEIGGSELQGGSSKIGVKKMRKLEMKAEKKAQREQEVAAREDKRKRELAMEQKRVAEEEKIKVVQKQMEMEEKRRLEEIKRKEELEYQAMKKEFEIQEEGCDESMDFDKNESLVEDFIGYCRDTKIVILEDLAAHFKLKVQDVIKRLEDLMVLGRLNGVFDDRGKFIFITDRELDAVCKFIRDQGRTSISDLVENSSRLINLATS